LSRSRVWREKRAEKNGVLSGYPGRTPFFLCTELKLCIGGGLSLPIADCRFSNGRNRTTSKFPILSFSHLKIENQQSKIKGLLRHMPSDPNHVCQYALRLASSLINHLDMVHHVLS